MMIYNGRARAMRARYDIDRAVHWTLNRPNIFLNTVGDIYILPKVLDAASRFEATSQAEVDSRIAELQMTPLFV